MFIPHRPAFSLAMALAEKAGEMRGVEPWRIARRERTRKVSFTRFGVVWVMRQMGVPLKIVAKVLAFNDHTSVMHAERRAAEFRIADPEFRLFTDALLGHAMSEHWMGAEKVA